MIDRTEAEEHLRVIRSLMEKATIYRTISAEAAAVGGLLAVAASFAFGNWWPTDHVEIPDRIDTSSEFVGLWLAVLGVTAGVNVLFLWLDARKRGDRLISAGMRVALGSLLPSYAVAAFFTYFFSRSMIPNVIVPIWIICHGLGLLATAQFAPRSLLWLGWAFLLAGFVAWQPALDPLAAIGASGVSGDEAAQRLITHKMILTGQRWMGGTFGLFHLIYAACTWPRKSQP